jgi:LuxR family maltose regulon positive regulatory protein
MMSNPLLETKFHLPTPHGRLVPRARLSQQINRATRAVVTLVSAPAGFGKTTVMSELAERPDGARIAWLSLDPADNDPVTFWTYVIEAVDRAAPGVGGAAQSILAGAQGTVDAAVATLLNSLAELTTDLVLVLDDLHVIESPAVHEQVGYLVEHLPARAHVVMGTRADPAIPLSRLRARGALVEIRASDLRFLPAEAASYLELMGLALSDENVATLEGRTEGWIAALQLAALSLQGRGDAAEFISAFAGDDRYIVDYLVEEVLRRQPTETRDFLLKTSILSRFTGPLADAVTGGDRGVAIIEALDRGNLFVVPLDSQRRWYRYHHLFGGVLQAYLAAERPDEVSALHARASEWFERNGDHAEAIEHALRANDAERVADLVELALPEMRRFRREPTMRRWIDAIPRAVVERRPILTLAYAGTILSANEVDGVDDLLRVAEQRIAGAGGRPDGPGIVVRDPTEFERAAGTIELYRAAVAKMHGDLEANIAHAKRVFELVPEDDHVGRGGAAAFLGLAYWGMGDLEAGYRWYGEGMASLAKAGHQTDLVGGAIVRADIRLAEGRLVEAERLYLEGLTLAMGSRPPLRGATDMHTGLAAIAYQRGQHADAKGHLARGRELGNELAFPRDLYRSRLVQARILQAEGDLESALRSLDEADRLYLSEFAPDTHPVAAIRARILVAHGRLAEARAWAGARGLTPADPISYVGEFEHTTFARLLIAEASEGRPRSLADALQLLDRLLTAAEEGRRDGSRLEILVTQALAHDAGGDAARAFQALDAAVDIAGGQGYVRVFLDEGPAMTRLLKVAARRPRAAPYIHALVRASSGVDGVPLVQQGLLEPLSERELDVLRLLRSDLDGPGMARELVVSLNTLRTHTKNIYAKLGVGSRRAAVRRAQELGLL